MLHPTYLCLVLLVALGQADINVLSQVGRDHLAELVNVLAVDLLGKAKGSVDDTSVESEEALSNLVGAGVLGVQASYEDGLVAVVVELEVDASLGEDCALVLLQGAGDLGVLGGCDETVLQDVSEGEGCALDKREKFCGPWVDVTIRC
jgi:hypothetical protein